MATILRTGEGVDLVDDRRENETVEIVVNSENNTEAWWDAAHEAYGAGALPEAACPLFSYGATGAERIACTPDEAAEVLAWAATLPGWADEDAPAYAPHPLLVIGDE